MRRLRHPHTHTDPHADAHADGDHAGDADWTDGNANSDAHTLRTGSRRREHIRSHAADMDLVIRPLRETDLDEADRVFRQAFGTFVGMPDPEQFGGDSDWIRTRWRTDASAAFAAELDGALVGSNFATGWGSVGFFGPLSVRPDLWDRGIARRLLAPVMERFESWGCRHTGLYTFAQSPKHVALYQRFGFYPRFLIAIMAKVVAPPAEASRWSRYSACSPDDAERALAGCRELTGAVYAGLDVSREIRAVRAQSLGDTLLLGDRDRLDGLAVCHIGPGSEAGTGCCYLKFAAVRPGAAADFDRLLDSCEVLAAAAGVTTLVAGVHTACDDTYRRMMARGFRTMIQGVAMHRDNDPGYHGSGVYVLDDWR